MKNSDLSNHFKSQTQTSSSEMSELKLPSPLSGSDDDDEDQIVPDTKKLKKLDIARICGKSMNPYTGSSAVMTTCKHFSHRDCLNKYYN